MKTPREILLARHQAAMPRLDAIRRVALREVSNEETRIQSQPEGFVSWCLCCSQGLGRKLWLELIWPCRRTWAGLAAVWLVILAFNLSHSGPGPTVLAKATKPPGEVRLAFQEQRRLLEEIIGRTPPVAPTAPAKSPRRPNSQPRSERPTVTNV